MPTRRTYRPVLALADLTFQEKFALVASWWRPGSRIRGAADARWRSWPEYFETYAAVRAELLAERHHYWPPFAELAWPLFQQAPDRFDPDAAGETYHAARDAYDRAHPTVPSRSLP
jgi:hypothetical protein